MAGAGDLLKRLAENGRDIEPAKKPFADYESVKEQLIPLRFCYLTDKITAATHAPRVKPSAAFSGHFDFRAAGFHLRQRGKVVVVLR